MSGRDRFNVTMLNRSEDLTGIVEHLTKADYQSFIDRGKAFVINLSDVSKIEIEEV